MEKIKSKLVYEIKRDIIVPVWHIEYQNRVFKYDAMQGDSFYEN